MCYWMRPSQFELNFNRILLSIEVYKLHFYLRTVSQRQKCPRKLAREGVKVLVFICPKVSLNILTLRRSLDAFVIWNFSNHSFLSFSCRILLSTLSLLLHLNVVSCINV